MFNVIEKEMTWRRERDLSVGFEGLRRGRPVVAVGAGEPLGGQVLRAEYYREWFLCCVELCGSGGRD